VVDDLADAADDEEVAEPLVEHQLGRDAGVGAGENDGERRLALTDSVATRDGLVGVDARARDEPGIALGEPLQSLTAGELHAVVAVGARVAVAGPGAGTPGATGQGAAEDGSAEEEQGLAALREVAAGGGKGALGRVGGVGGARGVGGRLGLRRFGRRAHRTSSSGTGVGGVPTPVGGARPVMRNRAGTPPIG
jgi:hypothetical protein